MLLGLYPYKGKHLSCLEALSTQSHHTGSSYPVHHFRWLPCSNHDRIVQGHPAVYDELRTVLHTGRVNTVDKCKLINSIKIKAKFNKL